MFTRCLPVSKLLTLFIVAGSLVACNQHSDTLFVKLSPNVTKIDFVNTIKENDSINPIDMEFLYNGGGVAVGDFNKDSLPDLYFTASTTSNKLYLNQGDLSFKDVTEEAKVTGEHRWANAASVIDINNDGLDDIYVTNTIRTNPDERKNLLYINQGLNKNNVPVFKEMAAEYGIADTGLSVHAAFFDYDNDGDLDMYLLTTKLAKRDASKFSDERKKDSSDADKLFRNDWSETLKHPVFTDVSKEAGIKESGYGLGIAITDINQDGWKDIYITNDFFTSDYLFINNKNGTFSNKIKQVFKHTSQNAMGNDVGDINNDGLQDIIAVDMNPEDNYRKKKNMSGNNYFIYQNMYYGPVMLQYVRNTLQLNMGPTVNANDSVGEPVFGDISFLAGVAETDWSWNPSIADFDNDGNKDIIITNGYPRDVTDHDFAAFRAKAANIASKEMLMAEIPQIKIPNYGFKNFGNLKFENYSAQWGLDEPSFSNGAVYADLDRDGDLDYVINNINEVASVYINTTNTDKTTRANFLEINFKGDAKNVHGIGAWVEVYAGGIKQVYENNPYRGYLSSVDTKAFFGMDTLDVADSVIIRWPNNTKQVMQRVNTNQRINADIKNANIADNWYVPATTSSSAFTDITVSSGVNYMHKEMDVIDFNKERLLPHKLSQYGPGLAAADVDGNWLDDIFTGGTGDNPGMFFLQQKDGRFTSKELPLLTWKGSRRPENMGLLLFDADNDGDVDLYCANGSNEFEANSKNYQDRLYINNGGGNFAIDTLALPENYTSKSCVRALDYDNDGDLDLFVGGRVLPGQYPKPVSSVLLRNDSKPGAVKFTDVTAQVAKGLENIGLVCDALFTDFDNDGFTDLVLAGEFMPVTFFKNNSGKFENVTKQSGIADEIGWWTSITAGDFDNDGDVDYITGNLGKNSFYRASHDHPVRVYGKDFDKNGIFDAIPTVYLKDQNGKPGEFTAQNRDDIVDALPSLKKKFLSYKSFGEADFSRIFSPDTLKDASIFEANNFSSSYIENKGGGRFTLTALPLIAQVAPLNAMVAEDINNDGNLDIIAATNDYGTEVTNGRYDALDGLVLLGDGKGNFLPQSILHSGFYLPGDGKALIKLRAAHNTYLLAASQNRDVMKVFQKRDTSVIITPQKDDAYFILTLQTGKKRKQEIYYGSSFLSQSSNFMVVNKQVQKVEAVNKKGEKRVIQ
ncbi:VCBS repeat-containing protein [Panacibacter sp. DH6]|uniref:VCBS repeat-containing protein n=1 Tax=Panacibacter microcysteis TaxID=2793269 RepID=A0A931GUG5_9BACT|nr:VCBS repeat-containing protein [Panacibacter microcysteis]